MTGYHNRFPRARPVTMTGPPVLMATAYRLHPVSAALPSLPAPLLEIMGPRRAPLVVREGDAMWAVAFSALVAAWARLA